MSHLEKLKYPRKIIIAPCSDLRQKISITVNSAEQIINAQKNRYEIIDLGKD